MSRARAAAAGLRRQLVERAAEHLVREPVRDRDVSSFDLDVAVAAFVLVRLARRAGAGEERDRSDERQVLEVVSPRAGPVVEEGQLRGVRVRPPQRLEQALGVLVELQHRRALPRASCPSSVSRSRWSRWMARVCSRPSSTVSTRQRLSSSSSSSIAVVVRKIVTGPSTWYSCVTRRPVCGSLPVEAIDELALALQELQGVARTLGALLLGDREHLVLQVRLAHVEERLARSSPSTDPLLLGHESEHRLHQRRLAGGRAALHEHRERPSSLRETAAK